MCIQWLPVVGLGLDLIGAGLLAAAEIHTTRQFLAPSGLRDGRETLWNDPSGLERGEAGFDEILEILDRKTTRIHEKELVKKFVKSSFETGSESIYVNDAVEGYAVTQAAILEAWIHEEVDRHISKRYRLSGAFFLIGGFLLQAAWYFF